MVGDGKASDDVLGGGEVVPAAQRPQKSPTLYPVAGLYSPHAREIAFVSDDGKGGEDLCGPYEPVPNWQQPVEPGWRMSGGAAVYAESADRIITVSHWGIEREPTTALVWGRGLFTIPESPFANSGKMEKRPHHHVVVAGRDGAVLESWTWNDAKFAKLNKVFVHSGDADHHVWLTDSVHQKIFKFSHDGHDLVMTIGEVEAGSTKSDPWKAQDIAWLSNGDFYTAGLGRIDRFNPDGKHVFSLRRRGNGHGEFADLHGIVLDETNHRIYLADRGNSRIQVFDEDWNLLDVWAKILAPSALRMTTTGDLWVADVFTQRMLRFDAEGRRITSWGQFGLAPGTTFGIRDFDTDEEGNLYLAEPYGNRVQKYRPHADVAPDDPGLVGPLIRS